MPLKKYAENRYIKYLENKKFIEWRLLQTPELKQYWQRYLEENPGEKEALKKAVRLFSTIRLNQINLPEETRRELRLQIIRKAKKQQALRKRIQLYAAAACLAVAGIMAGVFLYGDYTGKQTGTDSQKLRNEIVLGESRPNKDIQLITGGEVIELEEEEAVEMKRNGVLLVVDNEKQIARQEKLPENKWNKLIAPAGKRTSILLADGSKIWLNSNSEIEFPSRFTPDTRTIYIKGEVYIEAAENRKIPLCVHTPQFNIRVHGTKFNITAYEDDDCQSVVLVEGKVEITTAHHQPVFLQPQEMFSINSGGVSTQTVDVNEHISWKDGMLILNRTSVANVLKRIGRYYNVEFTDNGALFLSKTCTGKLILTDNLDDIMEPLSIISSITYYRENEKIFIENK